MYPRVPGPRGPRVGLALVATVVSPTVGACRDSGLYRYRDNVPDGHKDERGSVILARRRGVILVRRRGSVIRRPGDATYKETTARHGLK